MTITNMSTKTADEVAYVVEGWYWARFPGSTIRAARKFFRRKGLAADGDPQVHVVLVWPQDAQESAA